MDKSVVFAVAGSGKTTHLVTALDEMRRFLLVTYTEANGGVRNSVFKAGLRLTRKV